MEKLLLIQPTKDYLSQVEAYRKEMLEADSSMDGTGSLKRIENPEEWLEYVLNCAKKETVPEGKVQATLFICVRESDDKLVGMIQVRHYFSDYLKEYGGHIGYSVRPDERRKGYAKHMLQETLSFCKEIGLNRVLITCLDDNEASRKTILSNGGVFERKTYSESEDIYLERYWITL